VIKDLETEILFWIACMDPIISEVLIRGRQDSQNEIERDVAMEADFKVMWIIEPKKLEKTGN
jgi:hypothetical protein